MKKRTWILTTLTIFILALTGCQTSSQTSSGSEITEEKAKSIALADAGVEESELTNIRIEKDVDDGVSVYDVDFYAGNKEYDYEIDAATGNIRSQDSDIEDDFLNAQDSASSSTDGTDLISEDEASKIVLAKVEGASEQNLRISLDRDDGQDIYEGEIRYNGQEYEFELNAKTGDILEWSQEREDN